MAVKVDGLQNRATLKIWVNGVKVRQLSPAEGQRLKRIVRRGESKTGGNVVRWRRAPILLASACGNTVPVIAGLVAGDEDTVREVIHRFNKIGLDCLDPQWVGGRPRLLDEDEEKFVVETALTRPQGPVLLTVMMVVRDTWAWDGSRKLTNVLTTPMPRRCPHQCR